MDHLEGDGQRRLVGVVQWVEVLNCETTLEQDLLGRMGEVDS